MIGVDLMFIQSQVQKSIEKDKRNCNILQGNIEENSSDSVKELYSVPCFQRETKGVYHLYMQQGLVMVNED